MAGLLEYTKNGQVTEPPLYRFMRGNVQSFLNSIPDPSKMTPEQQLAMGLNANPIMGLLGTTAYHGSPYLFDKFNINRVGSGEGAQAYGHGMYFAENPNVANKYKEALKLNNDLQITTNGEIVAKKALEMSNMDANKAINMLKTGQVENVKMPEPFAQYMVENIKSKMQNPEGTLYKVDIPDEYVPKMLEWDKPLSAQNKEIQPAISQAIDKIKKLGGTVDKNNMTGRDLYLGYQQYRGNNPDFASEGLKDMGIYGIKYLDEFSRGKNTGTSNYVVFDPSEVKILEKNPKGILK
jgi:hypothetical protein